MNKRKDRIDRVKKSREQDVRLLLARQDGDDFPKPTRKGPVVLERMFSTQTIEVNRTEGRIR